MFYGLSRLIWNYEIILLIMLACDDELIRCERKTKVIQCPLVEKQMLE